MSNKSHANNLKLKILYLANKTHHHKLGDRLKKKGKNPSILAP